MMLQLLIFALCCTCVASRALGTSENKYSDFGRTPGSEQDRAGRMNTSWAPNRREREEWLSNLGYTPDMFQVYMSKLNEYRQKFATVHNLPVSSSNEDSMMDDMVLTPSQLEEFMNTLDSNRRKRATIYSFDNYPHRKWEFPINYTFDGSHDQAAQARVREAIAHWEYHTCAVFNEIAVPSNNDSGHYVIFTDSTQQPGCWSYVGKVKEHMSPQPINLQTNGCLQLLGIPIHEVGHMLGFWHEHQRHDRETYVEILYENIQAGAETNFNILSASVGDTKGLPYDFSSVMHYTGKSFTTSQSEYTIRARKQLHQLTMGHRTGLSFQDIKVVNLAYCNDMCPQTLTCLNGGYTNPNNCTQCLCPDGLGGDVCDTVQEGKGVSFHPSSSETLYASENASCISMKTANPYVDGEEGNWLLEAPAGKTIDLWFEGSFAVLCAKNGGYDAYCGHWLEIKYETLEHAGPRFCCRDTPTARLTSSGNRALVTFRAPNEIGNYLTGDADRKGFTVCYSLSATGRPSTVATTTQQTTTMKESSGANVVQIGTLIINIINLSITMCVNNLF